MTLRQRAASLGATLDRWVGCVVATAMWLALPLALLLFLQWPLRDWLGWGSREANDAAQCLFALFVAVAVSAATRARAHLASDALAHRLPPRWRSRLLHAALVLGVLPWAVYLIAIAAPQIAASMVELERFPDTFNPGYFLVKAAVGILAVGVIAESLVELLRPRDDGPAP